MYKKFYIFPSIFLSLLLSGCGGLYDPNSIFYAKNKVELSVTSIPSFATVSISGNVGETPGRVKLEATEEEKKLMKIVRNIEVRWQSGAAIQKVIEFNIGENSNGSGTFNREHNLSFNRPANVAGLELDVHYATQMQIAKAAQAKIDAQKSLDAINTYLDREQQRRDAFNNQMKNSVRKITNCSSTRYGNTVNTTCY